MKQVSQFIQLCKIPESGYKFGVFQESLNFNCSNNHKNKEYITLLTTNFNKPRKGKKRRKEPD